MRKIEPEFITGMGYIGASPGVLYHMGGAGEQTVVTGNPALLEGVKGSRFTSLTLYGISSQGSTTGAQLFDASLLKNTSSVSVECNGSDIIITALEDGPYRQTSSVPIGFFKEGDQICIAAEAFPKDNVVIIRDSSNATIANVIISNGLKEVVTIPANGTYRIILCINKGVSVKAGTVGVFSKLIVNKGNVSKDYEPYTGGKLSPSPEYPQEIENAGQDGEIRVEVLGKNLLRIDDSLKNYESNDYAGTSKRIISAGMVAVGLDNVNRFYPGNVSNCAIGNGNITYNTRSAGFAVGIGAKLIPEQTYICSYESTNNGRLCLLYYYADGTFYGSRDFMKSKTKFTIPKNVVYTVLLFRDADVAGDYKFWDIQLSSGDVTTAYEFYKPLQTAILKTPNGLPGIPVSSGGNYTDEKGQQWVADEIDPAKGERVQRIEEYRFTGTEEWLSWGVNNQVEGITGFYWYFKNTFSTAQKRILNTHAVFSENAWGGREEGTELIIEETNDDYLVWSVRNEYLEDTSDNNVAIKSFKKMLGEINAKMLYCLAESIRTPLPPETIAAYKALKTYSPTTTVINDAGAGMSVGYRRK